MQQIKLFKGLENDLPGLEKQVNAWLAESGARVIQIVGNLAAQEDETRPDEVGVAHSLYVPANVLLVLLYEKNP